MGHFEVVCRSQLPRKKVEKSKKRKSQGKTNTVDEESSSSEGESTNAIEDELGLIFEVAEKKGRKEATAKAVQSAGCSPDTHSAFGVGSWQMVN